MSKYTIMTLNRRVWYSVKEIRGHEFEEEKEGADTCERLGRGKEKGKIT